MDNVIIPYNDLYELTIINSYESRKRQQIHNDEKNIDENLTKFKTQIKYYLERHLVQHKYNELICDISSKYRVKYYNYINNAIYTGYCLTNILWQIIDDCEAVLENIYYTASLERMDKCITSSTTDKSPIKYINLNYFIVLELINDHDNYIKRHVDKNDNFTKTDYEQLIEDINFEIDNPYKIENFVDSNMFIWNKDINNDLNNIKSRLYHLDNCTHCAYLHKTIVFKKLLNLVNNYYGNHITKGESVKYESYILSLIPLDIFREYIIENFDYIPIQNIFIDAIDFVVKMDNIISSGYHYINNAPFLSNFDNAMYKKYRTCVFDELLY